MDTDSNRIYRDMQKAQEGGGNVVPVPDELQEAAEEVLAGRDEAVAPTDTEAGKRLREFATKVNEGKIRREANEKRRRRLANKRARKARKKSK